MGQPFGEDVGGWQTIENLRVRVQGLEAEISLQVKGKAAAPCQRSMMATRRDQRLVRCLIAKPEANRLIVCRLEQAFLL